METTMSAKWVNPVAALAIGLLFLMAVATAGQPILGLGLFAVMAAYGAVLYFFAGRNETVGMLSGRPTDERLAGVGVTATAAAGVVAVLGSLLGFTWKVSRGQDASDFALVAAAAGITYLIALVWLQRRG